MRIKRGFIGALILSILALSLAAISTTFAGFVYSQSLTETATVKRVVYLDTNASLDGGAWDKANAKIGCFVWYRETTQSGYTDHIGFFVDGAFMDETGTGTHRYQITVPNGINYIIFVRCNSSATIPNWSQAWNQTEDIPFNSSTNNEYKINNWNGSDGKSGGSWIS